MKAVGNYWAPARRAGCRREKQAWFLAQLLAEALALLTGLGWMLGVERVVLSRRADCRAWTRALFAER